MARAEPAAPVVKPPAKRARLSAVERRIRILDAAREVFLRDGWSGARTRDIAALAEVSEAALYRYFPSKEALYTAVVEDPVREAFEKLAAEVRDARRRCPDPIEFIQAYNELSVAAFDEFGGLHAVALYSDANRGRTFYEAALRRSYDEIAVAVAEHTGWDDAGVGPDLVRQATMGAQWSVGLFYLGGNADAERDHAARYLTQLFTVGVKRD